MNDSLVRIPSAEKYILLILVKTMTFIALFRMKTRVSHRYFVTECLAKRFFDSNLQENSSNLLFPDFFCKCNNFYTVLNQSQSNSVAKKNKYFSYFKTVFLIFLLRLKFGVKSISSSFQDVPQRDKLNSRLNMTGMFKWAFERYFSGHRYLAR